MYDLDIDEGERDDWVDKWLEPCDPRGEGSEANTVEDEEDKGTGGEEQEKHEEDQFDRLMKPFDLQKEEA